jgi:hypothetical protein
LETTARPRNAYGRFHSKIRQKWVIGSIPSLDVLDADRRQIGFVGIEAAMGRHRIGGESAFDGQTKDLPQPLEIGGKSASLPNPQNVVAARTQIADIHQPIGVLLLTW